MTHSTEFISVRKFDWKPLKQIRRYILASVIRSYLHSSTKRVTHRQVEKTVVATTLEESDNVVNERNQVEI